MAATPKAIASRQPEAPPRTTGAKTPTDVDAISRQIFGRFCRIANVTAELVTPDALLTEIGLDSLTATEIASLVEETYDIKVQATLLSDCPTLRAVAVQVGHLVAGR